MTYEVAVFGGERLMATFHVTDAETGTTGSSLGAQKYAVQLVEDGRVFDFAYRAADRAAVKEGINGHTIFTTRKVIGRGMVSERKAA